MFYIALTLVALILILRLTSPKRYAVQAAVASNFPPHLPVKNRWLLAGFLRDEDGHLIDPSDKFIGFAVGESMATFGIPDGVTFIGDPLSADDRQQLETGDIVVVDGAHKFSPTGLRLRRVEQVKDGKVYFSVDGLGKPHKPRDLAQVVAKVTRVVNPEGPAKGLLGRLLSKRLLHQMA